jgi:hypothetical protein
MSTSTTTFAELPLTKRCSRCGRRLPADQFRRRSKGSDKPHADCRECHRIDQRRRRAHKAGQVFRQLASDVHRYRGTSIDRLAGFIGLAIDSFGGLTRFVQAWRQNIDLASQQGKPHVVIRQLGLVMELMLASDRERKRIEQETIDQATPEEIRDDMRREFFAMLVEFGETDEDARDMVDRIVGRSLRARSIGGLRWGTRRRLKMYMVCSPPFRVLHFALSWSAAQNTLDQGLSPKMNAPAPRL